MKRSTMGARRGASSGLAAGAGASRARAAGGGGRESVISSAIAAPADRGTVSLSRWRRQLSGRAAELQARRPFPS